MTTATPRRIDRQRRQRILDATLKVLIKDGLSGLSHRRIAKTAGVPLSATSYYFGSLDELVEAAFTEAVERDRKRFQEYVHDLPLEDDPVGAIVTLSQLVLADDTSAVLALEICVGALRQPRLKPLARSWDDAWRDALTPALGARKARLATAIMTGIVMRTAMSTGPMPVAEISELVRDSFEGVPGA